jgi:para-nitrobenzyl esterase
MRLLASIISVLFCFSCLAAGPRVMTASGLVEGVTEQGIDIFRGIPYAAPPVNQLRWRAPQPVATWAGARKVKSFGDICPQMRSRRTPESENCLLLNVWAPADADGLPVMLWIHGGANVNGSGNTDGSTFARDGVVLVSLNYRLGRFGVFSHPELTSEAMKAGEPTGNYGVMDQIAALRWIQHNIAAFGGNPNLVTIFGVSAGGSHVNHLMASPESKGLFHRAIAQSGANGMSMPRSLSEAEQIGVSLADSRGGGSLKGLRGLAFKELVDTDASYRTQTNTFVDGEILPNSVPEMFRRGLQNNVPYIAGANSFEGSLAAAIPIASITRSMQENLDQVVAIYGRPADDKVLPLLFYGDVLFVAPTRYLVDSMSSVPASAWNYHMAYVSEALRGNSQGTRHGGEVQFVFDRLRTLNVNERLARRFGIPEGTYEPSTRDREIASMLHRYWIQFAIHGDPNGPGLPRWSKFSAEGGATLVIANEETRTETGVRKESLDLIEASYLARRGLTKGSQ